MCGCSALNCSNSTEKNFKMYRFPKDPERRKIWIDNCKRSQWEPGNGARLCEVHFEESQFESKRQDGRKKLRWNAVPTLFKFHYQPAVLDSKRIKGIGLPKPGSLLDNLKSNIQFEKNRFKLHRQDGRKNLKPHAVPTNFPDPPESPNKTKEKAQKIKRSPSVEIDSDAKVPIKKRKKYLNNEEDSHEGKREKSLLKKNTTHSSSDGSSKENVSPPRRKGRPRKISNAKPESSLESEVAEYKIEEEEENEQEKQIAVLRQEVQEFEKHNKAMHKVILELEKHNKAMSLKLLELDQDNKIMSNKLQDLEKQNEYLKSKLNCCFSEEQYARMEKLMALGKIERYIPGIK